MIGPTNAAEYAQLVDFAKALLEGIASKEAPGVAGVVVRALAERLGTAWVRGQLDAWEAARAAADAAAEAKFGPDDRDTGR